MTYTIAGRQIDLDKVLDRGDEQVILKYMKLFKYCLNHSTLNLLIHVKQLVHLYTDVIMIYSTLLSKIPDYEDVRAMSVNCKNELTLLEDKFNEIFSNSLHEIEIRAKQSNWQYKAYETIIKTLSGSLLNLTLTSFETTFKTLTCIELFFDSFNNLKKLLIPYLLNQTKLIINSIRKAIYLLNLSTITDSLASIKEIDGSIIKQLVKIEKITSGIDKESVILNNSFKTFDPSLQQYTSILLGKAILKRNIQVSDCKIIKRREICYQAAEHVVSIPLTEDQPMKIQFYSKYITLIIFLVVLLSISVIIRLLKVLFTP